MQSVKNVVVTKSPYRRRTYLFLLTNTHTTSLLSSSSSSSSWSSIKFNPTQHLPFSSSFFHCCYCSSSAVQDIRTTLSANDILRSMKDWFQSSNNAWLDRIFQILSGDRDEEEVLLSQLGLRLSESLVLDVLSYGDSAKKDVLSCLKFFDWAGRQPGFYHTRATFHAIFRILAKAKLMALMFDFLDSYMRQRFVNHKFRFYGTLVMGYAVAGKPDVALQLFGRMRFQGIDLDDFTYHVLLNSLVEEGCFDEVEVVAQQISLRGFENDVTHSIMVKCFCKQNLWEKAEEYLLGMLKLGNGNGRGNGYGHALSFLVDTLCKNGRFEKAEKLIEEFRQLGVVTVDLAYGVWIRDLVQAGKVGEALEFLKEKQSAEGYVPEVFRYNILLCRLLKEKRLNEACEMLMEMKESMISPDKVTMNAALCFFCKAGMVDVALGLYNSRSEFELSVNSMAYNYLINSLCGDGSIDEAFRVLRNSTKQGYFPGKRTFYILADALCREGKLDKMAELVNIALERNFMPTDSTYDKFISALCRARRVQDGYVIHRELGRTNRVATRNTYSNLIYGFNKSNRGDIAASLLIEMQEKGHKANRALFRTVILSLCCMNDPESQFLKLLDMQLSHHEPSCHIYNFFIDGAGHAKKPELSRKVYEMMQRSGIKPNVSSDILMLQSYIKSGRISDAMYFFDSLHQKRKLGRKLYNSMIVGLCKVNRTNFAMNYLVKMKNNGGIPSMECYEVLIKELCSEKKYDVAVGLINDLAKVGRQVTSFVGNILLLHSLRGEDLYEAWVQSREINEGKSPKLSLLGQLIGAFCGRLRVSQQIDNLEEVIEQCFPLDIYTYNMLLRRLSMNEIEHAYELFNRICQKGYEPNRWTYDILVHGFFKHGRTAEARRLLEEMFRKGFHPTEYTKQFA